MMAELPAMAHKGHWRKIMTRLNDEAIQRELAGLPGWAYADGALHRAFTFPTFMRGIGFVNKVADLAEDANHHPDITINYNRVTLALSTHDEGGVSDKDVSLARGISGLVTE